MGEERVGEIDEFICKIKKKFNPQKIILFGSRARGEHLEGSDYDIIIVSEAFKGMSFLRRLEMVYEFWDGERRMDVLCYTPEEFEKKKRQLSIVKKAVEEGKML